jgi:hypothetical protein
MNPSQWLVILALGLLMGSVGQGARIVVGLKKANEEATSKGKSLPEVFEASTLLVSLLIGAIAGAVAAVTTITSDGSVSVTSLMGLAAAGYSGADFLEGIMQRYTPDQAVTTGSIPGVGGSIVGFIPSPGPAPGPRTPLDQAPADVRPLPAG